MLSINNFLEEKGNPDYDSNRFYLVKIEKIL